MNQDEIINESIEFSVILTVGERLKNSVWQPSECVKDVKYKLSLFPDCSHGKSDDLRLYALGRQGLQERSALDTFCIVRSDARRRHIVDNRGNN